MKPWIQQQQKKIKLEYIEKVLFGYGFCLNPNDNPDGR